MLTHNQSSQALDQLKTFSSESLKENLIHKGVFKNEEEFDELYMEFLKFAYVTKISNEPVAMMSAEVDEIWHQFILYTRDYQKFCNDYLGEFLHHIPSIKTSDIPVESEEAFRDTYEAHFGPLHSTWLNSESKCRACTGEK